MTSTSAQRREDDDYLRLLERCIAVSANYRPKFGMSGKQGLTRQQFEALEPALARALNGVVFEVRQGYKSADSGRQHKDIGNAANAYACGA